MTTTLAATDPESAGRMKFPAAPGLSVVQEGAPSVPPAELSLNCQVKVGVGPENENLVASTPNVLVLGTVASNGISKSMLKDTNPPATGMTVERTTKFVSPSRRLIVAPPAVGEAGFQADAGAPSVVATAATSGLLPFPAVPVNCSRLVVANVESSHDSSVGFADRFWLNTTRNTFRAELLLPAPVTFDGIDTVDHLPMTPIVSRVTKQTNLPNSDLYLQLQQYPLLSPGELAAMPPVSSLRLRLP